MDYEILRDHAFETWQWANVSRNAYLAEGIGLAITIIEEFLKKGNSQ